MSRLPHFDPPNVPFAAPFWEAIAHGELRLPRCSVCGTWQWYPDDAGTCCAGGSLAWVAVSGAGTVHTFTTINRPFLPSGGDDVPFTVAFIELDDAPGVRFVANVDGDIGIGMRVAVAFTDVGGRPHPVFRAA